MVGGCVEYGFKPPWHAINRLRMYPELIQQGDGHLAHDHQRMEAEERQPEPEYPSEKSSSPCLSQGGAQIVALTAMVYHMRGPEEVSPMAASVHAVVGEVLCEEENSP